MAGGERREPWNSGAGEKKKKGDRHSSEIRTSRVEGNKTEEQGARNGAWILRFPRIPLIYILSWHRKEGKERKGSRWEKKRAAASGRRAQASANGRGERGGRGGGRAISAVCMRGRRQTLLNCPMTPYIPFYPVRPPEHTPSYDSAPPRLLRESLYRSRRKLTPRAPRRARSAARETTRRAEHSNWDSPPRGRGRITPEVDFDWRSAEKRSEK